MMKNDPEQSIPTDGEGKEKQKIRTEILNGQYPALAHGGVRAERFFKRQDINKQHKK